MDMTRRKELAVELRRSALATSIRIVSDGERLKAQANMAEQLVEEAEQRTAELLAAEQEIARLRYSLMEAQGHI